MRLPRDLAAELLIKGLKRLGYETTRKSGSHIRMTIRTDGEHHITIPNHSSLRVGTLSAILNDVASYLKIDREELLEKLLKD